MQWQRDYNEVMSSNISYFHIGLCFRIWNPRWEPYGLELFGEKIISERCNYNNMNAKNCKAKYCCLIHDTQNKKKTMHSCSASPGKPDSNALDYIVFSCFLVYLYPRFIRRCRCSFGNWCICNTLIFTSADALLATGVSAIPWYSLPQILFFRPKHLQLTFLWTCRYFSPHLACTIASTSCLFMRCG